MNFAAEGSVPGGDALCPHLCGPDFTGEERRPGGSCRYQIPGRAAQLPEQGGARETQGLG